MNITTLVLMRQAKRLMTSLHELSGHHKRIPSKQTLEQKVTCPVLHKFRQSGLKKELALWVVKLCFAGHFSVWVRTHFTFITAIFAHSCLQVTLEDAS